MTELLLLCICWQIYWGWYMFLYSRTKYANKCFSYSVCIYIFIHIFIPLATKQSQQSRQIPILTIISINFWKLIFFYLKSQDSVNISLQRSCICFQDSCFKPRECPFRLSSTSYRFIQIQVHSCCITQFSWFGKTNLKTVANPPETQKLFLSLPLPLPPSFRAPLFFVLLLWFFGSYCSHGLYSNCIKIIQCRKSDLYSIFPFLESLKLKDHRSYLSPRRTSEKVPKFMNLWVFTLKNIFPPYHLQWVFWNSELFIC